MAVTLTHTQIRSVIAGDLPYQVADTVTAATGISTAAFVFVTESGLFSHVATVYDMETFPISQAAAVSLNVDFYRMSAVTVSFADLPVATDASVTFNSKLLDLVIAYNVAVNAFVGVTTTTVSS